MSILTPVGSFWSMSGAVMSRARMEIVSPFSLEFTVQSSTYPTNRVELPSRTSWPGTRGTSDRGLPSARVTPSTPNS